MPRWLHARSCEADPQLDLELRARAIATARDLDPSTVPHSGAAMTSVPSGWERAHHFTSCPCCDARMLSAAVECPSCDRMLMTSVPMIERAIGRAETGRELLAIGLSVHEVALLLGGPL